MFVLLILRLKKLICTHCDSKQDLFGTGAKEIVDVPQNYIGGSIIGF
ncbi:hypothetical protein [Helicobacter didelphidarum]|nr:hypothetical protein [Helicobacter didelphidarum]